MPHCSLVCRLACWPGRSPPPTVLARRGVLKLVALPGSERGLHGVRRRPRSWAWANGEPSGTPLSTTSRTDGSSPTITVGRPCRRPTISRTDDPTISVDINENDGRPLIVTSASPFSFGGSSFLGGQYVRAVLSSGEWTLSEATSCSSSSWVRVASQLIDPVAVPSSLLESASTTQALTICVHGGGTLTARDSRGLRRAEWCGHLEPSPPRAVRGSSCLR